MQRDRAAVARTWLATAQRDLRAAKAMLDVEPSLAPFHAQQAGEKAIKALLVAATDDHPRTHVAGRLIQELREIDPAVDAALAHDAAALDLFYLTTRYPDSVGDADPADIINREDAEVAVARAERLVAFANSRLQQ